MNNSIILTLSKYKLLPFIYTYILTSHTHANQQIQILHFQ